MIENNTNKQYYHPKCPTMSDEKSLLSCNSESQPPKAGDFTDVYKWQIAYDWWYKSNLRNYPNFASHF